MEFDQAAIELLQDILELDQYLSIHYPLVVYCKQHFNEIHGNDGWVGETYITLLSIHLGFIHRIHMHTHTHIHTYAQGCVLSIILTLTTTLTFSSFSFYLM